MKNPIIDHDQFGEPIYKTLKKHRSMQVLDCYSLCNHYCFLCFKNWTHRVPPNWSCKLYWVLAICEPCMTYDFNLSKEDKYKLMTPNQRSIIDSWIKKRS
jgi:hypothetical protein